MLVIPVLKSVYLGWTSSLWIIVPTLQSAFDRVLTIHRAQHTGRPELWLSVETEIYGWAESAWRKNESDILKR